MASKSGIWYMDYQPSLTEIVGNERAKKSFLAWFGHRLDPSKKSAREMDQKNCGLLYGPPGTGKTALVRAAARELGVMLIELDASELRNKEEVSRLLDGLSNRATLFGETKKALLIDDADAVYDDETGYMILNMARQAKSPVVLTAVSKYAKSLRFLRGMCAEFPFSRLTPEQVFQVLKSLSQKLGLYVEDDQLSAIAKASGGDARAAINDLQSWAFGERNARDAENEVKDAVELALSATTCDEILSSLNTALSSVDAATLMLWFDENLPYFTQESDVARAFDWLARADRLRGMGESRLLFNVQRRGIELVACGLASRQPRQWETIGIPWRLFRGREVIEKGKERAALAAALSEKLHVSSRKILAEETFTPLERAVNSP
ncbi:MAG: AAA family ATPase [Candidatus Marsarchaeota archaeon]